MLYIRLKAYDHLLLENTCKEILSRLNKLACKGPIYLPKKKKFYTVIRSSHIYSLSREQFGLQIHNRVLVIRFFNNFFKLTNFRKVLLKKKVINKIIKNLLIYTPPGISLKIIFKKN